MQELFALGLGNVTTEEYEKYFMKMMRYVGFIKDEKVNIKRFLTIIVQRQDKI
jgi:hypothetical protein